MSFELLLSGPFFYWLRDSLRLSLRLIIQIYLPGTFSIFRDGPGRSARPVSKNLTEVRDSCHLLSARDSPEDFHCIAVIQSCTKVISMPVLSIPPHLFPDMCVNVCVCAVSGSFVSYKHIFFLTTIVVFCLLSLDWVLIT
jgi:hypothetical protein